MSEVKFTKNNWEIAEGGVFVYALNESGVNAFSLLLEGNAKKGADLEELKANAHLIAAAPEMYEMLEDAAHALSHELTENNKAHIEAIRQLLAKARGE
jgi:hypothetical protein